jgi:hypothetical protein
MYGAARPFFIFRKEITMKTFNKHEVISFLKPLKPSVASPTRLEATSRTKQLPNQPMEVSNMAKIIQTNSALVHIFFAIPDPSEHIEIESQEFRDYLKTGPHYQFLKLLYTVLQDAAIGEFECVMTFRFGEESDDDRLLWEIAVQGAKEKALVAAINHALSKCDLDLLDVSVCPQSELNWVNALHEVANAVSFEMLDSVIDALPAEAKAKAEEDIRERINVNGFATPGDTLVAAIRAHCDFMAGVLENHPGFDEPDTVMILNGATQTNQLPNSTNGGI